MGPADALIEEVFRRESGRIVAWLARLLGPGRLDLIEDAVQEAFGAALDHWPFAGPPEKPAAWLATVARNKALDRLRREARLDPIDEIAAAALGTCGLDEAGALDDALALIFVACHPSLEREEQLMLTLKTVSGFGVQEIARAFLSTPEAVTQRLVRAKRKIRDLKLDFEIPRGADRDRRLPALLEAVYLLFNAGYTAGEGESLIARDLCAEALRLAQLLLEHPATATGEAFALAALICFHHARAAARIGDGGSLILLAEQDRRRWDHALIARGFGHLRRAMAGSALTPLHIEAGIASLHAAAPAFAATDWRAIAHYYEMLNELKPTPVVQLNCAIALAYAESPARGLAALDRLEGARKLQRYGLYHAARGDLLAKLGRRQEAEAAFTLALACPLNEAERAFLTNRRQACSPLGAAN
jgi:RNA polymerase sigma-70 factor (ECF subfamily)